MNRSARLSVLLLIISVLASTEVDAIKASTTTATLNQCGGPVQLSWQNAVGQVDVAIVDDAGKVVKQFDRQPANTESVTWYPINATAGQRLYLATKDESGATSISDAMTVTPGSNSCRIVADDAIPSFTLFTSLPAGTGSPSSGTAGTPSVTNSSGGSTMTTAQPSTTTSSVNSSSVTSSPSSAPAPTTTTSSSQTSSTISSSSTPSSQNGAQYGTSLSYVMIMIGILLPTVLVLYV